MQSRNDFVFIQYTAAGLPLHPSQHSFSIGCLPV
jgi:hypothetical protein